MTNNVFVGPEPHASIIDTQGRAAWDSNLYLDVSCLLRPRGPTPGR